QHRQEKKNQNAASVARTGDDRFSAIGAARHHEEGCGNKRPERQFCSCFRGGNAAGRNLRWKGYSTQFFLSSSSSDSRSQKRRSKLTIRRIQSLCAHARKK